MGQGKPFIFGRDTKGRDSVVDVFYFCLYHIMSTSPLICDAKFDGLVKIMLL